MHHYHKKKRKIKKAPRNTGQIYNNIANIQILNRQFFVKVRKIYLLRQYLFNYNIHIMQSSDSFVM